MKTYPLFKVHVPAEAIGNIEQVLDSGFINEGVQVTQLTEALSEHMHTDKLCLLNSCTSALTLALKLAGVGPGDEVITTPMTCVATNTPIVAAGAKIVWADVDPETGMLDPADVQKKITPKTKAIIAVAWAGAPPDLQGLNQIRFEAGIPLILDAAHAFDATYAGQPVHRYADFTCYSFQAIKHFTTGDGGALICWTDKDFARAKALKWFGLDRDRAKDTKGDWKGQQWDVDIVEAGYKFNMNNVAAAIGISQLEYIDNVVTRHRANSALLERLLVDVPRLVPVKRSTHETSSNWVHTVLLDDGDEFAHTSNVMTKRDLLLNHLNEEGIMAGVVHVPNDAYTCFSQFACDLPGVRSFSSRQFSLPCGWWLNEEDVRHIAERVKACVGRIVRP